MKWVVWVFAILFCQSVLAATLTGSVFDLDLKKTEAIVTISTEPEQRMVAENGTYTFKVPAGTYILSARTADGEWFSNETITVGADGVFVRDIILEPDFSDLYDLPLEEEEIPRINGEHMSVWPFVIVGIVILVLTLLAVWRVKRQPPAEDDEYKQAVLETIRKHKGRISQKQLRKEMPFSEAKVSLVVAELEDDGRLKKIKKGRGNILVLEK